MAASLGATSEDAPLQMEMVSIKGAEFTMGTPIKKGQPEYHDDETPLTVTVTDFRIGEYPVTAEQMCAFLNSPEAKQHGPETLYNHKDIGEFRYSTIARTDDGRYVPREGAAKAPANQVTWKGAVLFCAWLSDKTKRKYRLPSEAEWELAARGKEGRKWPWGEAEPGRKHGARYGGKRAPVGSYPRNATPEGVQDMLAYIIGEWCANKYAVHPTAEQASDTRADLDDLRTRRVVRGYYHRYYRSGGWLLVMTTKYGWRHHLGRPWTRIGESPMKAPQQAARFGFRVVEELGRPRSS
jgi:formylglycine-generating enzyme required for sulfatase activity